MPYTPEHIPTQDPLDYYQRTLAIANQKVEDLKKQHFGADPTLVASWNVERDAVMMRAAQYIAGLVGKADTDKLREAVAPESLKDVLECAGVGYETLMLIGEGQEELQAAIEQRRMQMSQIEKLIETTHDNTTSILEHLWKKAKTAEKHLADIEAKPIWTRLDAKRYPTLYGELQAALQAVRTAHERHQGTRAKNPFEQAGA